MENRTFSMVVGIPFALMFIIWMASSTIHFKPGLSKREKEILGYTYEKPIIAERSHLTVAGLTSPVRPETDSRQQASSAQFPVEPLPRIAAPAPKERPVLSLVVVNEGRKTAIIDGRILHEGEKINGWTVARISTDRVLLTGEKGEEWITMHER